ncbi:hypothetical protein G6M26_06460 [Agrobacterium tumefaciens]|nr:hypothetical protein [Agrobacterium tumefaciens]NTE18159.1 hypothetical protein [Agrobacterium tumefaciens]
MKKIILILISVLLIGVGYIYFEESTFSPLKEKDFQHLFPNSSEDVKKECSSDFLGISTRSEFFEIYTYTGKFNIDSTYPTFKNKWENKEFTNDVLFSKWKSCPIDSTTMSLYKFILTANNLERNNCFSSLNQELNDPNNFYSFVYFNELEQYFLLYSKDENKLFYIRKKGF